MKYRILSRQILKALKTFPAIIVTGPRQSGKTTLLKKILGKTHTYVNLENPDVRFRANADPVNFLDQLSKPVILDEVQYVPELLSYIKTLIDDNRKAGRWVLTGSQNFALMQKVSESLAGRAAILSLLPFSFSERQNAGQKSKDIAWLLRHMSDSDIWQKPRRKNLADLSSVILRGNYPEIASNSRVDKNLWCGSYISTYLERDIRNLAQVGDLNQFERFVRLCASRTGQILNISELARGIGVSVPTAKRWLSLLETGYQIFLLYPYYKNIGKRLVKSPKLYFNDTGLAAYLLGIENKNTLINSPHFGNLFETLVVTDFWKRFLHNGQMPSMYYLKTRDNLEIDLALESAGYLHFLEIKSAATITAKHAASLVRGKKDLKTLVASCSIISQAKENFSPAAGVKNFYWQDILMA